MKGQSVVIIASVFTVLVLLSIIPLYVYLQRTAIDAGISRKSSVNKLSTLVSESSDLEAIFDVGSSILVLANRGSQAVVVDDIIIHVVCGNDRKFIKIELDGELELQPGLKTQVNTSQLPLLACGEPDSLNLYVITSMGGVIKVTAMTQREVTRIRYPGIEYGDGVSTGTPQPFARGVSIIPLKLNTTSNIFNATTLLTSLFEVYTLDSVTNPKKLIPFTNATSSGMRGGNSTHPYVWMLLRVYQNTNITINNQAIRNLWIGYDPRNTSKYNILITCDRITFATPPDSTSNYTRIKIYGFKPLTTEGILRLGSTWIQTPSQDVADYTFNSTTLYLNGIADRVEIYIRVRGNQSSYDPYILLMNTVPVESTAGLLFTTIDRTYGDYTSRNDYTDALLDYSTQPLVLVYKGYPISNVDSTSVILAVNYAFHDNEGADARGTTVDLPIMILGIVDESNNVYFYRSYNFRELTMYEDTYPPTAQAQSSLVFIPLPPPEVETKTFYVFIAIQDPYSLNGLYDDLDFTLYISSISIIPIKSR